MAIKKLDWLEYDAKCPYNPEHGIRIVFPPNEPSEIRQPCSECHHVIFITIDVGTMLVETAEQFYKRREFTVCQS